MTQKMTIPPEFEGEYTVRIMDLPLSSPGFVLFDDDDHANIYLNARYNRETNAHTAAHELIHIINDDIHNSDPIEVIEARADGLPAPSKSLPRLIRARDLIPSWDRGRFLQPFSRSGPKGLASHRGVHAATHPRGTGDGSSNHLSNSLPRLSKSLPLQGKVARLAGSDEVVPPVPHSPVPHSPVPSPPASLSPRQAAVLLNAVNDLDTILFDPDHDMIDWR